MAAIQTCIITEIHRLKRLAGKQEKRIVDIKELNEVFREMGKGLEKKSKNADKRKPAIETGCRVFVSTTWRAWKSFLTLIMTSKQSQLKYTYFN